MENAILIIIVVIILFIVIKNSTPEAKGRRGEKIVSFMISSLPEDEYKVLNDIMLKSSHGTTQIDHIVVSLYGIFIIETKNYKGFITGNEFSDEWTKNMYGKKYNFRNPLKQNYAHLKSLEEFLNLQSDKFIPIVVFSDNTDINVNTNKTVIYMSQLKSTILNYKDVKLNKNELEVIINKITSGNIISKQIRYEHEYDIRYKIKENKTKIENQICPHCGGNLINRKGKYGYFLGCSNYPKCKFILKAKE
jgi:ribosomal protein S27AE